MTTQVTQRSVAAVLVVAGTLAVSACGGGEASTSSTSRSTTAGETASTTSAKIEPVIAQCEQAGATALLPNSAGQRGQDSSALPDNTPAVCGCWTQWMVQSLTPAQLADAIATVEQGGPVIILTGTSTTAIASFSSALGRFVPALKACILRQTPNGTRVTSTASSTASSSAASTASSTASSTSSSTDSSAQPSASGRASDVPPPGVAQYGWLPCTVPQGHNAYSVTDKSLGCGFGAKVVLGVEAQLARFNGSSPANLTVGNGGSRTTLNCISPKGTYGEAIECSSAGHPWVMLYLDSAGG